MQHRRIVKKGPIVLATEEDGSLNAAAPSAQGLFLADTRFLSSFKILLNGLPPVLLGSSEEILFEANYLQTNPAMGDVPANGIGLLQRNRILDDSVEITITVANWALEPVSVEIGIQAESDFFDSFEARGMKRLERGELDKPVVQDDQMCLRYHGLDDVTRVTRITVDPPMDRCATNTMYFPLQINDGERKTITLRIHLIEEVPKDAPYQLGSAEPLITNHVKPAWFDRCAHVTVENPLLSAVVQRSIDDLEVLMIQFPDAWVPAAGLPRFGVPFGRDCLYTGIETLMWNPALSRDVLRFLARRQGKVNNPWNYEQPGKIMHEMHTGELARLKEVPFGLFYGSVDSTPLFLVLGAEYLRWTGDLSLYRELKDNFEAAWNWIWQYGDIDGSGYVQYQAHTAPAMSTAALSVGLFNQGWKDSANALMYASGEMVKDHPIALAEVQGDLYRALLLWSKVYAALPTSEGTRAKAEEFLRRADDLAVKFNREFWMPAKGYYAMALDGHHNQVDSITSNPAECLWSRLIDPKHADDLVKTLTSESMFTQWGIRTMANTEKAYNPFSYHDGSIWPFENALFINGLKKYGYLEEATRLFQALLDAALYFEYLRWPEVYCGVSQQVSGVLARQPNASRPQSWSAGAIFLILQSMIGLAPRAFTRQVDITPALPTQLEQLTVDNMPVLDTTLSLNLQQGDDGVLVEIKDNPGDLDVLIHPVRKLA